VKRLAALAFALLCPVFSWAGYNSYTEFASGTAPSYDGLWWNPSESGWGVSIAHQGDVQSVKPILRMAFSLPASVCH
jgi:hypothetical protein